MTDQKPDEMPANYKHLKDVPAEELAHRVTGMLIQENGHVNKWKSIIFTLITDMRAEYETRADLCAADDALYLKNALRDVMKAIVSPENSKAIVDTIWVNGSPIGDFIGCAIDEEVDVDTFQKAPYRCKKTAELFVQPAVDLKMVRDLAGQIAHYSCLPEVSRPIAAQIIAHIDSVTGGSNE